MPGLIDIASQLGVEVYYEIKESLGDDWKNLSGEQRTSIDRTAKRFMELQLRAKGGEDVSEKLQAVESTVTDWKTWGAMGADTAFWKGVQKVAKTFGAFLGGAAIKFIGG